MRRSSLRRSTASLLFGLALVLFGAAACSSTETTASPGSSGAAPGEEAGPQGDIPDGDLSVDPGDAGSKDAPVDSKPTPPVGDILGTIASGACGGLVKAELSAPTPSVQDNLLVFVAGEAYDKPSLSPGGQTLFDTPNAGGSSTESETMSFEVLRYCDGAKLLKTETQILYQPPTTTAPNTISDILVEIDGKKVGVSVTRVYKPASQPPMTDDAVKALIEKKLVGIVRSSERVLPQDKWVKQILHVFTVNKTGTDAVVRILPSISAANRADTIVLITQTTGGGFVYCHPLPALGTECP